MIKAFIDGEEISGNFEVDFSFVQKLDRELDEGFIVVSHTDKKDQYPMFSNIEIFEDTTLLFSGRISDDTVKLSSFSDEIYNHTITLIEHTKILEKYIINGKSFTQPIDKEANPGYSLYDVVKILQETAIFEKTGQQNSFSPFEIPQVTKELLEEYVSPEFSFKDVTLRQALDEVASVLNAITRLDRNGEIFFDKFNELLNEITVITENYRKHQNIQNYSTLISSDIINPVQEKDSGSPYSSIVYPGEGLWTSLRSRFGQFNFAESYIPTDQPIYEVLKAKTKIQLFVQKQDIRDDSVEVLVDNEIIDIDITDNIVEKNIFSTLEEKEPTTYNELTKKNVIIYTYGQKNIRVGETYGLFDVQTAFRSLVEYAVDKYLKENNIVPENALDSTSQLDMGYIITNFDFDVSFEFQGTILNDVTFKRWKGLFNVEYIPIPRSIRYEVMRDDITEVDFFSYGIINQKLRIVDINSFTNNMKGRINQLSSGELILSHKVKNISESWNLGDFTEDKFVITKKEVIAQRDHYIINYELNKNFNKISQFIGIDQEIRQWEIGESGRTLDRDLNYNEYIEMYLDDNGEGEKRGFTLDNTEKFLNTFNSSYSPNPIKFGIFSSSQVLDDDGNEIIFNFPFYKVSGGDSFGFHSIFDSNASIGQTITEGDDTFLGFEDGRGYNIDAKYTDRIGRFDDMYVAYSDFDLSTLSETIEEKIEDANSIPILGKDITENPDVRGEFYVKKDNRERLKFTLLYHLISKNIDELVIGNKLSSHNALFLEETNQFYLKLFNNRNFTSRDKELKIINEDFKITDPSITINEDSNYVEINENQINNYNSWALVDQNDIPYLMSNVPKKRIVFDFKNKRSGIRYVKTGERLILEPPEVISFTANATSIEITVKNNNEESVEIQVGSGTNVQFFNAEPEETVLFTIPNLIPNFNYPILLRSNPLSGSLFSSSLPFFSNIQTDVLQLSKPSVTINSLEEIEIGSDSAFKNSEGFFVPLDSRYKINVTLTNDNEIDLVPRISFSQFGSVQGFGLSEADTYSLYDKIVPSEESLTFDIEFTRSTSEVIVDNFILKDILYSLSISFRTFQFQNNFFSGETNFNNFSISQLEPPEVVDVNTQFNTILFDIKNNNTQAILEVDTYSILGTQLFGTLEKTEQFIIEPFFLAGVQEVTIAGLENNSDYRFVMRFKPIRVFDLQSEDIEPIRAKTDSVQSAPPVVTRNDSLTTETELHINVKNQDTRPVELFVRVLGFVDRLSLGVAEPNETKTFVAEDLSPGNSYIVTGYSLFEGESLKANTPQFLYTRPAPPQLNLLLTSGNYADVRVANVDNESTVSIFRSPGTPLGNFKPASSEDNRITGLSPGNNYTATYYSQYNGLTSSNSTVSFTTKSVPNPPQLSVAAASNISIFPKIYNPNSRSMIISGLTAGFQIPGSNFFNQVSINDEQGVVSGEGSALGFEFRSTSLSPNQGVQFSYRFKDFVFNDLISGTTTETLYTTPLPPVINNFSRVVAGPDVVQISFDVRNDNLFSTINVDAQIEVFNASNNELIVEDQLNNIPQEQTTSFTYNLGPGDLPDNTPCRISVTFSNPTTGRTEIETFPT